MGDIRCSWEFVTELLFLSHELVILHAVIILIIMLIKNGHVHLLSICSLYVAGHPKVNRTLSTRPLGRPETGTCLDESLEARDLGPLKGESRAVF